VYNKNEKQRRCSTMAKNQKNYTPEFKQQIVDLYNTGTKSFPQLEREYGVSRSSMSGWVKQLSPINVSSARTSFSTLNVGMLTFSRCPPFETRVLLRTV
jgi:transposase-like protein